MSLKELVDSPFELLLAMEKAARAAIASRQGHGPQADEWIGIGFRLGAERFVAARADVREVLPVPEQLTRVPGAKPWLRGIANVRGQLLTIADLKTFLGAGRTPGDRHSRILHLASRDVPTAVMVDEVLGFKRFSSQDFERESPPTAVRCEHYLRGGYAQGEDRWPLFSLQRLLEDEQFLNAGEQTVAAGNG